MKKSTLEMGVGIFALIGIICVGYLTIKLGKMELLGDNYYILNARFDSVSGLKPGAPVEMAGVEIGRVGKISLKKEQEIAIIELKLTKGLVFTEDAIASVRTSGLIGDKFIKIAQGGSEEILKPGDVITETESSVDLEELIGKYVFGGD